MKKIALALAFASAGLVANTASAAEEVVAGALVHHGHAVEQRDRRRVEGLLHQAAVVQEGRTVEPLRGARQGR